MQQSTILCSSQETKILAKKMLKLTENVVPVIFLACLLVFVQSKPTDNALDIADKKCLAENDVTREGLEDLWKQYNNINETHNLDRKYKCYLYCLADEVDILDSEGNFDIDQADSTEELTEAQREVIMDCKKEHDGEEDTCEYAFNMMVCVMSNLGKNDKE